MKGVAARYPAFDKALGRPVDLEQRINLCRVRQQQATPLAYESRDLLALTALVARAVARRRPSRPAPIRNSRPSSPTAAIASCSGRASSISPAANCHDDNWDKRLAGCRHHARTSDRLSAVPAGVAIARLAAAPPARLPVGHPRPALRLRRAGTGRTRALSDVARPRHADRGAGGAAVTGGSQVSIR